jgi:hypothetical protein
LGDQRDRYKYAALGQRESFIKNSHSQDAKSEFGLDGRHKLRGRTGLVAQVKYPEFRDYTLKANSSVHSRLMSDTRDGE